MNLKKKILQTLVLGALGAGGVSVIGKIVVSSAFKLIPGIIRRIHDFLCIFKLLIVNRYRKEIIRTGRKELIRNPFCGRFAPRNSEGESYGFELRIINAHIMCEKGVDDRKNLICPMWP